MSPEALVPFQELEAGLAEPGYRHMFTRKPAYQTSRASPIPAQTAKRVAASWSQGMPRVYHIFKCMGVNVKPVLESAGLNLSRTWILASLANLDLACFT